MVNPPTLILCRK